MLRDRGLKIMARVVDAREGVGRVGRLQVTNI